MYHTLVQATRYSPVPYSFNSDYFYSELPGGGGAGDDYQFGYSAPLADAGGPSRQRFDMNPD
jgi:hypothetical protein